ncbi:ribosomal large subunit pseudouridine synthase D [Asticcacaulis biprosthecium C19]|uniref:Pseudouridine synthase n=1 Tax=Asticcacaulis biprosthecium C19 TaxID=715226 RepID=F4QM99_9CAUL|nr:RluA family pseudouridine synthase [Asticcacaulis biprosthecium]EGF91340.1 ribosomal large subunit pseudouridine synthase D [Asticcacaulis biprosthecium C19]
MNDTPDDIEDDDLAETDVNVLTATVTADEAGDRLDRALTVHFPDLSRARLQALIAEGRLSHNGAVITDGKHKARPGDYSLSIPALISANPEPQDIPLDILFEDEHLIVINKAPGMAAHPAPGTRDGTLVNALLFHCGESLSGIGGVLRPGIVHRLDKDTSGVMVAAKSDVAHRSLSELFGRHDIDREYKAVVRGAPRYVSGTVNTRIGRSHHDRKKMAVLRGGGREAITHYRLEEVFGTVKPLAALLSCRLETGRTHQIRVHMAHLGCPCLGDPVYGSGAPAREVQEIVRDLEFGRQALHAGLLGFVHPITGEKLKFKAKMPDDMVQLVEALQDM